MSRNPTESLLRGPSPSGLVLVSSLIINLLSLAMPVVILQVYDRILPNQSVHTLLLLVVGLGGVLVVDALLRFGRSYIMGWAAAQHEHRANCAAVESILSAPIAAIEHEPPGTHLVRLSSVQTLRGFHAGDAHMVLLDLPFVLVFLSLIWAIGGDLVVVPALLVMALGGIGFAIGASLRHALEDRANRDDLRYSFILEVLARIPIVKSMAMEPLMQRRYERLQASQVTASYQAALVSGLAQGSSAVFASIAIVAVVAAGSLMVGPGGLTLGELSACTLLTGRAMQPILRALNLWTQFQSLSVAKDHLAAALNLAPDPAETARRQTDIKGGFELRDLTFRYHPEAKPALAGISLSIAPGEIVAVEGKKDSGRTTLLSLMSGLLQASAGEIYIDGEDISQLDPIFLRQQISYLPNHPVLFQGTVLENLTMFRGEVPFEDVVAVVRQLGLEEVIGGLPAGYETKVGDGSENELPIGIMQLLVIARCLISKPRVILFNQANSRLDQRSDALLRAHLEQLRGDTTIILVSHRPSLIAIADRTLTLAAGRLVPSRNAITKQASPLALASDKPGQRTRIA